MGTLNFDKELKKIEEILKESHLKKEITTASFISSRMMIIDNIYNNQKKLLDKRSGMDF